MWIIQQMNLLCEIKTLVHYADKWRRKMQAMFFWQTILWLAHIYYRVMMCSFFLHIPEMLLTFLNWQHLIIFFMVRHLRNRDLILFTVGTMHTDQNVVAELQHFDKNCAKHDTLEPYTSAQRLLLWHQHTSCWCTFSSYCLAPILNVWFCNWSCDQTSTKHIFSAKILYESACLFAIFRFSCTRNTWFVHMLIWCCLTWCLVKETFLRFFIFFVAIKHKSK